jgi:hypothetical protein
MGEVLGGEGEGVGAEILGFPGEGGFKGGVVPDATEAAGVEEADVGAGGEFEDEVGVFGDGGGGGEAIDAAGHAQVEVEGLAVIGGEKDFFAVAVGAGDVVADKRGEGGVFGGDEIAAEDADGGDADIEQMRLKGAADFLDFGEFGHDMRIGGVWTKVQRNAGNDIRCMNSELYFSM